MPSSSAQLRRLLCTAPESPVPILEAHSGLSARIAAEAGFPALWASGLSIAAALGVRDNNEASWTQVLEVVEFMVDAAGVPVLVDGDTGFGNFNNVRRVVRKLGERGAAGVCLEDKLFPKTNSFLAGTTQPLAPIDEFCGKIKAAKDSQRDDAFVLVARTEALIAGWSIAEALRRAEAYRRAGADAVVVHSASATPDDVLAFLDEWANRLPVVLIPTKYVRTPVEVFAQRRVAALIWANHLLRASIGAMQGTAAKIMAAGTAAAAEPDLVPLAEVFRLQRTTELREAEERYLPGPQRRSAIVLAATRGGGPLHALTEDVPKTLLRVGGVSLLGRLCDQFKSLQMGRTTVVAGYRADAVEREGLERIINPCWAETREVASLALALEHGAAQGETVIAFGDVLCRRHLLEILLNDPGDFVIVADRQLRSGERDRVRLVGEAPSSFIDGSARLAAAGNAEASAAFHAEWTGLIKASPAGVSRIRDWVQAARSRADFTRLDLVDLLDGLARQGQDINVHLVAGGWTTVEDVVDLAEASNV